MSGEGSGNGLSAQEREQITDRAPPRAAVVYETVRHEGEDELARSSVALAWSGLAAGISIGLSVISEGLLATYLPDAHWKPLVENLGYCVGFLVVIMARQQLFTENTITVVLPFLKTPTLAGLASIARLWTVVLAANLAGCLLLAAFLHFTPTFPAAVMEQFMAIAEHLMHNGPLEMFTKGILAGWLIATLVWLLPSTEGSAEVWLIVLITYLIALGGLTHVVAGSAEVFLLWLSGGADLWNAAGGFFLPTLAGNVVGGTALFALISYGQVHDEIA
jgi:formate/nitrite transporter FocA (FNT family)